MTCPSCAAPLVDGADVCACGHAVALAEHEPAIAAESFAAPPAERTKAVPASTGKLGTGKIKRPTHRFAFHGKGGAILGMFIVNCFLTAITFGIYAFWAKAKMRRYFMSQLEFQKQRFAYHGTGKESFLGALKVMGTVVGLFAAVALLGMVPKVGPVIAALLLFGAQLAVIPLAVVGARKYFMSRTSLNGIRFSFRGDVMGFVKAFVPGYFLTCITLGLYFPFFEANMRRYLVGNTYYGSQGFSFKGEGKDLFKDHLIAMFAFLPTAGLILPWYLAKRERYFAQKSALGAVRFHCDVTGGQVLKHWIVSGLLIGFTFGIATPWVLVRNIKFKLDHLRVVGDVDLAAIKQQARLASSTGEELGEALDLDVGMGLGL